MHRDELRRVLRLLGSSPEEQEKYINSLGDRFKAYDELALEFEDLFIAIESPTIGLQELDDLLDKMSGSKKESLWTHEGLVSSPEWAEVRRRANDCLLELEQTQLGD